MDEGPTSDLIAAPDAASALTIAAVLAFVGGYLDGFTYLDHGHVFANAMTGNVVLLGLNCLSGSEPGGLRHLPPIVMFVLGVSAARSMRITRAAAVLRNPYLAVLLIEITVLLVLSLQPNNTADIWFTTSIAFVASMQVETFSKVRGRSYNSTFTTGNLRTLSEGVVDWICGDREARVHGLIRDFSVICLSFGLGAVLAGWAAPRWENRCLWLEVVLLAGVGVQMRIRPPAPEAGRTVG